jgi:hypothetical protein
MTGKEARSAQVLKENRLTDTHGPRQTEEQLLSNLHDNFGKNLANIDLTTKSLLESIDLNSRTISEIRNRLSLNCSNSDTQQAICSDVLDEVFTDFSIAMYLCTIGLIVPARMSARRGFELGLAAVYMWDLPHQYWGWRKDDVDLGFSEMVTHLNSKGYQAYLAHLASKSDSKTICNQRRFQETYRALSNTVHGKFGDLPPLSPSRFVSEKNGVAKHLELIAEAQALVIELLLGRFDKLASEVHSALPILKRP